MRWVVSAWVSMTMADLCTASGSVFLVTAGVFEVVCAASGRVAANSIKAREIFMLGAGLSVSHFVGTHYSSALVELNFAPVLHSVKGWMVVPSSSRRLMLARR